MDIIETFDIPLVESVMAAEIRTNPVSILITPKVVVDGDTLKWEGHSNMRCKGCGNIFESKAFVLSVLETIIHQLQDE